MKTTIYLYEIEPSEFINMRYEDVLKFKIFLAKKLIAKLIEIHYSSRDTDRISAINKAIKFNEELLKELKE